MIFIHFMFCIFLLLVFEKFLKPNLNFILNSDYGILKSYTTHN